MRLSICIPTYNFGRFIGETLDSILSQAQEGVEVLVVDGGSTDETPDVVAGRKARFPGLRYERLASRGGIDADLARTLALAHGERCWLFSADDRMRPGALARALEVCSLAPHADVLLCKHAECTFDMRVLHEHPVLRSDEPWEADLGQRRQRLDWLERAVTTEALFSFMGSLIVRRSTWLSVEPFDAFFGSCWAHVARLLTVAERRGSLRVRFTGEVWLDRRGDNDSFSAGGRIRRMALSIDGLLDIAERFFGAGSAETRQVARLLQKELPLPLFLQARQLARRSPERESEEELRRLLCRLYAGDDVRSRAVRSAGTLTPVALTGPVSRAYALAGRLKARARGLRPVRASRAVP